MNVNPNVKILVILLLTCIVRTHAQSLVSAPGGTPGYVASSGNTLSPQNGNGTLGTIFDSTACGLQFVTASQNANIIKAFLWTNGSGTGAAQTATISGPMGVQSFPMPIVGMDQDFCWVYPAAYTYRADVTAAIAGDGTYNISGLLTNPPTANNDMNGAMLMIIFNDPTATFEGRIILADGALTILSGTGTANITYDPVCTAPSSSAAFCIMSDMQYAGSSVNLNSSPLAFTGTWWNYIQLPTTLVTGQATSSFTATKTGDCFCMCMVGLYMQTSACISCPSTVQLTFNTTSTPDLCNTCNGTAAVTFVSGGMGPYSYAWGTSPVQTTATASGLCAGTYSVVVTSSGGFYSDTQLVVVPPAGAAIALQASQQNVTCNGGSDGTAMLTGNGGTGPYNFLWSPAVPFTSQDDTTTAQGLTAGIYLVTMMDAFGCGGSFTFTITEPSPIGLTIDSIVNPTCNGDSNGLILLSASGGNGGYVWNWSHGDTTNSPGQLGAGIYSVVVSDSSGCTASDTIILTEPPEVTFSAPYDTLCMSHGVITLTGASPPGGLFSGTGVTANMFDASLANVGFNVITYTDSASQCMATDSIFVDICTDIGSTMQNGISIYPNPASDILYVTVPVQCTLEMYNQTGQLVYQESLSRIANTIDLSGFSAGIYYVRIVGGNFSEGRKIMVND